MKNLIAITFLLLASVCHAQDNQKLFEQEIKRIYDQHDAGKLTVLETAIEMEGAAKAYFPNDGLLQAYHASTRQYAEQFQSGSITRARFLELQDQRLDRFMAALADRDKLASTQRAAQEQSNVSAASDANRANFLGNFLRSMATSTNRAMPRPPVNCTSYALGNSLSTTCQ